jgi:hypothetical protein
MTEANSEEFLTLIRNEMETLVQAFDDSKKVLLKLLARDKSNKEKEDELVRLRIERARLREELRAELKEDFEGQKDQIIMDARSELTLEKEKWMREQAELKKLFEEQSEGPSAKGPSLR